MRKGLFNLKLKFEGNKILDNKFNTFEELEESMDEIKLKFKGRK